MRPVSRAAIVVLGVGVVLVLVRNVGATGGAAVSRGRGTAENMVALRVVGAQVHASYATFHAPDPGLLQMLTFDVSQAGSGAGTVELGVVRNLSDGGVESLCSVNIPCTTAAPAHIHPDAGSCNDAIIAQGEHLKVSPIVSTCGNYPDGTLVATFLWE